ncbi:MAG: DUF302 domain-containing protein [Proteobacteria bacterium]|nr:DUF302 domain-containing protein [Pseudomonadota bacterium]
MTHVSYGIEKNLGQIDFNRAIELTTDALKTEGFGVLTEIDVKSTLKKKLDVNFRDYKILGACNPPLAHQALENELSIGLLLPCNVVVFKEDDGTVTVSAINPQEMFRIVDNPNVAPLAEQVETKLRRALDKIV